MPIFIRKIVYCVLKSLAGFIWTGNYNGRSGRNGQKTSLAGFIWTGNYNYLIHEAREVNSLAGFIWTGNYNSV